MVELKRTSPEDPDLKYLNGLLDADLWKRYPQTQQNYMVHNILNLDVKAIVAYDDGVPVACGCFRMVAEDRIIEIKRMYVAEKMRGRGIAKAILHELEKWATELGENKAILETGINQPEAIALYTGAGYGRIKNYGPYIDNRESVCMGKDLPGIPLFFVSQDK